jgi:hypothetical protein
MEEFNEIKLDGGIENATLYRTYIELLKMLPMGIENYNVWFGGGCYVRKLLGEKVADIDFFGSTRRELARFTVFLRSKGFKLYFSNRNAIKGYIDLNGKRVNIDVIKILFKNEIETINKFDFSVSKIVTNPKESKCYFYQSTFVDLLRKRLVIPHELTAPIGTLKRLQKYVKRGFSACDGTMLTLSKAMSAIDFNDPSQNMIEFYPDGSTAIPMWD